MNLQCNILGYIKFIIRLKEIAYNSTINYPLTSWRCLKKFKVCFKRVRLHIVLKGLRCLPICISQHCGLQPKPFSNLSGDPCPKVDGTSGSLANTQAHHVLDSKLGLRGENVRPENIRAASQRSHLSRGGRLQVRRYVVHHAGSRKVGEEHNTLESAHGRVRAARRAASD
ncbi:jg19320 [Pararge aegeria aegeria]|uniref:Jg19320 protein n=1 Tax=Pararge aegeria aegeria TaxID=348720 RepID=A0A8S4SCM9_9NEOP|nr:jg19320 [Pararge aegeria aegeria]